MKTLDDYIQRLIDLRDSVGNIDLAIGTSVFGAKKTEHFTNPVDDAEELTDFVWQSLIPHPEQPEEYLFLIERCYNEGHNV